MAERIAPESPAPGSPRAAARDLQELLLGTPGVEAFLTEVARLAAGEVAAELGCGLMVRARPDSVPWSATSSEFARRMDTVQYEVDDGPCLHCLRHASPVEVPDIGADERWPAYRRRGRAEGAGSSLSVPMAVDSRTIGALNLYSRMPNAFTAEDRDRAARLAHLAAGAIGLALLLAERERQSRHLETALTSRSTIDQALGILMGRHRISAEQAFDLLRRHSQQTNTKLRDLAAALVASSADGADPTSSL
ncbi:GAF and ANTAR domain-containing protein [Pseudonocardia sichuanensis]